MSKSSLPVVLSFYCIAHPNNTNTRNHVHVLTYFKGNHDDLFFLVVVLHLAVKERPCDMVESNSLAAKSQYKSIIPGSGVPQFVLLLSESWTRSVHIFHLGLVVGM